MSNIFSIFAVYKLSVSPFKSSSYMTKEGFNLMYRLFAEVIARTNDNLFSYAPSAHLIDHCGGYELELHPDNIVWDNEIVCLCAMAAKLCHTVECCFYKGSIIIR